MNGQRYNILIFRNSLRYGVPSALIKAVIKAESNYNPRALRYEKAHDDYSVGLMQIMNKMHVPHMTQDQLMDPTNNIRIGTAILKEKLMKWPKTREAIAAYNSGSPIYRQGKLINAAYVDRIYRYYKFYSLFDYALFFGMGLLLLFYKHKK